MKKLYTLILTALIAGTISQSHAQTQILMYTNMGGFVLEMYDTLTPITSGNFIKLTNERFYDATIFHRVISGFVVQGGDPTGTGSGGPGYTIQDEFVMGLSNIQWTISMANTGAPNSGGSQFFINLVDNTFLDFDKTPLTSKHPVFGHVLHNTNVVADIGVVPVDGNDRPVTAVRLDSARVIFSPTTSIRDRDDFLLAVRVFPNPVVGESMVSFGLPRASNLRFALLDNMGREVGRHETYLTRGDYRVPLGQIAPDGLASGVYSLMISDGTSVHRTQIAVSQ